MPELPEVETTRRGIDPHLAGQTVVEVVVRHRGLRQPVSDTLESITGDPFTTVTRRSKYLVLGLRTKGCLLIHLGMSGSLRLVDPTLDYRKHDHVGITLANRKELRFHDPRRFGIVLHLPAGDPYQHPLLAQLGPEPLTDDFTTAHLHRACASRRLAIKNLIMDGKIVVGVGNIYASEALFRAGIRPRTAAGRISRPRLAKLVDAIKQVLTEAIEQGGTTLRDFVNSDGQAGYFKQRLFVYDRAGEPCRICGTAIKHAVVGQRATYWCPACQS